MPMPVATRNPMNFRSCGSCPDYIAYPYFDGFVAYGMMECWPSHTNDLNQDWEHPIKLDTDHVTELRGNFLDLLESTITGLWAGELEEGQGALDTHLSCDKTTHIDDETYFDWYVTLQDDAIMFQLMLLGDKPQDVATFWLDYTAIEHRPTVVKVLKEAFAIIGKDTWAKLEALATEQPA